MTDAQSPKGEPPGRTDGQTEAIHKDEDVRLTTGRVVAGVLLLLAAIAVILWIFLARPDSLAGTVSLVALVALLLGGISVVLLKVLPPRVRAPLVALVGVAVVSATLIATFLTIPSRDSAAAPPTSSGEPSAAASQGPADPMTATLDFDDPFREFFTIPRSLLPSLPNRQDDVTAEWIYQHGGASVGEPVLTLQGKTESAVIIKRLRVIDVERRTPPSHAVVIFPDGGGGGVMAVRYFELKMSDPPQVISRRGIEDPDGHRDPAVKLPVKVSNNDPEQFVFHHRATMLL